MSLSVQDSDSKAKKTLRHLWGYGQKIEAASRAAKHTVDLFSPEVKLLRKKLQQKCSRVLLQKQCPYSRKIEELLWKKVFYDVIQKCKQHRQALDGTSLLWDYYSKHISLAMVFYNHLLLKMEQQFGVRAAQLSAMNDVTLGRMGIQWLKDVVYKSLIHLGDLARYQVALGGDIRMVVAYYHKAITIDPTNGTAFNQLAVLLSGKNSHLDSIYYYQRSIRSSQPFSGSEANMMSLFDKNHQALVQLQSRLVHTTDADIREVTKRLLFLQFIQLQHALYPSNKATNSQDKSLGKLCEETLESFRQCLEYDLQTFKEGSDNRISNLLSGESCDVTADEILLPPDVLLKLIALCILPSHSLRELGSTLTQIATAFALSVFSHLLSHTYQCIVQIIVSAINVKYKQLESAGPSETEIADSLEHGKSIVAILLEHGVSAVVSQPLEDQSTKQVTPGGSSATPNPSVSALTKQKKHRMVDRRRRKRGDRNRRSSGEEDDSGSDCDSMSSTESLGRVSSDEDLSLLSEELGEDDLELLDSLSDSSSDEEKAREAGPLVVEMKPAGAGAGGGGAGGTEKKASKRKIVLAANFSMPPSTSYQGSPEGALQGSRETTKVNTQSVNDGNKVNTGPTLAHSKADSLLGEFVGSIQVQSSVHTACCLVAEEGSLMALRVFVYWLQSYPIIIATCTQSSATMWSRIASLINVLPTRPDIMSSDVAGSIQNVPLLEDLLLREFPPIVPALQAVQFGSDVALSALQQTASRIYSLQSFGYFLAEARTAPSFTFDDSTEKFEGPLQKALKEKDMAKATETEERKQADLNRSKLMKAMAQRRLQSEVSSLAEASSKTDLAVFTPYLIPDANTLCSGLHIVKKLVKTEKFVFIIAKAVIESLDNMKKSRESYAAREAIKFLEKELHSGNKFIQAQKTSESLHPGKKKPTKMEIQDWLFECLVDCACYFNQTYAQKGQSQAVATLIVEKRILDMFNDSAKQTERHHVIEMLTIAQQNGVDFETMIGFHINWSKSSKKKTVPRK